MKGLWTKDIRLISSQQKNLAVIWLVAAGILIATDQISFAISYTSVITIMTAISTISYDTFDNGNAFLFTLPFSRKEYTREKYLFSLFWGYGYSHRRYAAYVCSAADRSVGMSHFSDTLARTHCSS